MSTNKLGIRALATHFKVTSTTITNWIDQGLPVHRQARKEPRVAAQFDIDDCQAWFDEREQDKIKDTEDDPDSPWQKARLAKIGIETARLQLKLDQERGELVAIAEIAEQYGEDLAIVKALLLAIPAKVAPHIIGQKSVRQITQIIKAEIIEVLEELSTPDEII